MERPWLKHVVEGNPHEIEIPEIPLTQLFQQSVQKYKDHTAVTFYHKTFTYGELYHCILRVASSLAKRGIKKGDSVAIMLPNCPQYPISYYAALMCGATIVQINPMYKSSELLYVLNDSNTKALIVLDHLLPIAESILDQTPVVNTITVSFEKESTFDQLLQDADVKLPNVEIDPKEDVAVLQYTGGTTGRSKGAMLTHYNLVANTLQSAATAQIKTRLGEERVLTISPLFHVYGMTSAMNLTFLNGGNLILVPKFEVEQVVKIIEQTKPTAFPGVPTMYIALLTYYKSYQFDLSCLTTCTSGSAPLPVEVINRFNEISGTSVAEGYGLSEASPVTHRNPISGLQKRGSIGIPIPNTDAKIVDIATGEEDLGTGEVGELVIKGPQIMKGYLNMPEETASTIRDGWLYTGDLAMMDADGFFYIVGRKKEMILASGFNVYPIEIEDVIYSHPDVLEAAVIGIPDEYRGETVKAIVVLKEKDSLPEEDLIQFCRERLAAYKVPSIVTYVDELPKTAVGKILKRKLKELYSTK
ncbi:long-chain acyl-CoA synthetase [Bacillus mesophilus]|uniref:Long-chain fatty acid--CoA ligase n=1 Tax=Bacillus mesophilus TaxID=1808955 RepID=A0A6M0QC77_9BACI|nr:long-chain fatty acid--CoA ligase [Bacillus mesophilus]MBM7661963.1 long-chain acyl-CoA synthetase [Bacillus mesophilus]NEY72678.1 long-chain fatty acid--CoA ligase [Bacillus mesophilus]